MRALKVPALTTKMSGFLWRSTRSTVALRRADRAGSGDKHDHQIGMRNDVGNGVGYRRGCIDDSQANAAAFEMLKRALQIECADLGEGRRFSTRAFHHDAMLPADRYQSGPPAQPRLLRFDRQMAGERRFAGTSLLEAIATTNMKEPSIPGADSSFKGWGVSSPQRQAAKIEAICCHLIKINELRAG